MQKLKYALMGAALSIFLIVGALSGLALYYEIKYNKPTVLPGTCFVTKDDSMILEVTGVKDGKYQVQGLLFFVIPFQNEMPYKRFNMDLEAGSLREIPCE